jgi:Fic family protein
MAKTRYHFNELIIKMLSRSGSMSSGDLHAELSGEVSLATLKRIVVEMLEEGWLIKTGTGKRNTVYSLSKQAGVLWPIDVGDYFKKEIDERSVKRAFDFDVVSGMFDELDLFTKSEKEKLDACHHRFTSKTKTISDAQFRMEYERLAIDLSWKSSQIEGNTYSLLETEVLLKEQRTAKGKTRDEATMLINHKTALDFLLNHPDYVSPMKLPAIEDVHFLLIKDLDIDRNIRNRRVGITGTNYRPLENQFRIREALEKMCEVINKRQSVYEKALLTLALISYIQPFSDGNKRTARIVSNGILMHHRYCPLSFRTVDPEEYKLAMLVFYEQNNISAFKKLFIEQVEFAVDTYF